MKSKYEKKVFPLIILILMFMVVLAGCDFFTGPAGVDGINGINGVDGGNIPGGIITISYGYDENISLSTKVWVVFDPDENIMDGNETRISVSIGEYLYDSDGAYGIQTNLPWHAPGVAPGSYYVYCWLDYDGDEAMSVGEANGYAGLYGFDMGYYCSDYSTISNDYYNTGIFPNYTFWEDFAPQITIVVGEFMLLIA